MYIMLHYKVVSQSTPINASQHKSVLVNTDQSSQTMVNVSQ